MSEDDFCPSVENAMLEHSMTQVKVSYADVVKTGTSNQFSKE